MIESLPPRPLSRAEADRLVEQTDQKFIPDTYIDTPGKESEGYVGAIFHREDGELLVGLNPDNAGWEVIKKQPPTATLTETYDALDEWAEEHYGDLMGRQL